MIAVVTLPHFFTGESEIVTQLLESGAVDRVHVRKPGATISMMQKLLDQIPQLFYGQLSLHDCHPIAVERGCGVHLNRRNPSAPGGFEGVVSISCHSAEELSVNRWTDYRFISPVFPSISKPGYNPSFTLDSLRNFIDSRVIALGGVTPNRFPELAEAGLGGAALSGYVWEAVKRGEIKSIIQEIREQKVCFNL